MKYFIIDEFGVRHRYPYEGGGAIEMAAEALEHVYIAGATVIAERVVMLSGGKVIHFDPSDEDNLGKVVGLSKNGAAADQPVTVVQEGIYANSGMGLTPNEVYYAGTDGTISTTVPANGIFIRIGISISSGSLKVDFSEPVLLIN
jgi:hypothetical protein